MHITFSNYTPSSELLRILETKNDISVHLSDTVTSETEAAVVSLPIPQNIPHGCKTLLVLKTNEFLRDETAVCAVCDIVSENAEPSEFFARIMRLIAPATRVFEKNGIKIDYLSASVEINDTPVHLTMQEYRLLCLLSANYQKTVPYSDILHSLWESPVGNEMITIRVFVNSLRKKLKNFFDEERILTVSGKGYMLN